jgi:hypothetical protein
MTIRTLCPASTTHRDASESPSVSGAETPDHRTASGLLNESRESRQQRNSSALFTYAEFMIG